MVKGLTKPPQRGLSFSKVPWVQEVELCSKWV